MNEMNKHGSIKSDLPNPLKSSGSSELDTVSNSSGSTLINSIDGIGEKPANPVDVMGERSANPKVGMRERSTFSSRNLVTTAMLFAIAIALGLFENLLPPLPAPIPLRYGLSNIAVMYALLFLGAPAAFTIAILKSIFAVMTRGLIAGLISLSGGLVSFVCMYLINRLSGGKASIVAIGVTGAVTHNLGQYLFVLIIDYLRLPVMAILPLLLVTGVITGLLSAALLKAAMPAFKRLHKTSKKI